MASVRARRPTLLSNQVPASSAKRAGPTSPRRMLGTAQITPESRRISVPSKSKNAIVGTAPERLTHLRLVQPRPIGLERLHDKPRAPPEPLRFRLRIRDAGRRRVRRGGVQLHVD